MRTAAGARIHLTRLARAVHRRASEDSIGVLAAGLTYYTFLSLFPVLLLGLSALGFFLAGSPKTQADWVARLTGSIPGLSDLIGRNLKAVVDGRLETGIIGLVGASWTASSLTGASEHALATVFKTPRAGFVRRRLRALGLMAALGLLAGASVFVTGFAAAWSGGGAAGAFVRLLGALAGLAVDLGFFLVVYRALTPRGVRAWQPIYRAPSSWHSAGRC